MAIGNGLEPEIPLRNFKIDRKHRAAELGALHMITDEINATGQLKLDFESYLKGEEPPYFELACAPLLERWRVTLMQLKLEDGALPSVFVLVGYVTGHPRYTSARTIHTSQLIWLDRDRKWARTWNRLYRLGDSTEDEPVVRT
jgi:hypothetical protein